MWTALVDAWDWILNNPEIAGPLILFGSGIIGAVFRAIHYWRSGPRLEFGLDEGDENSDAFVTITNIGGRTAQQIRIAWTPRSSITMSHVTQPFPLLAEQTKRVRMRANERALLLLTAPVSLGGPGAGAHFGLITVAYTSGWKRRQVGCTIVRSQQVNPRSMAGSIDLVELPHRSLRNTSRLFGWLDAKRRGPQRRMRRMLDRVEWRNRASLRHDRATLENFGIRVSQVGSDEDRGHSLLRELRRRGWHCEYKRGGPGYEVDAKKFRAPTISDRIKSDGQTLEEAATRALARALDRDDEHRQRLPQTSESSP